MSATTTTTTISPVCRIGVILCPGGSERGGGDDVSSASSTSTLGGDGCLGVGGTRDLAGSRCISVPVPGREDASIRFRVRIPWNKQHMIRSLWGLPTSPIFHDLPWSQTLEVYLDCLDPGVEWDEVRLEATPLDRHGASLAGKSCKLVVCEYEEPARYDDLFGPRGDFFRKGDFLIVELVTAFGGGSRCWSDGDRPAAFDFRLRFANLRLGAGEGAPDPLRSVEPPSDPAAWCWTGAQGGGGGGSDQVADFTLACEESEEEGATTTTIACHKSVLAARSPVFRAMLSHEDLNEIRDSRYTVKDADPGTVRRFVNYLYDGDKVFDSATTTRQLLCLLLLADKYMVGDLRVACSHSLAKMTEAIGPEDAALAYRVGKALDITWLADRAVGAIRERPEDVAETDAWAELVQADPRVAGEMRGWLEEKRRMLCSRCEKKTTPI